MDVEEEKTRVTYKMRKFYVALHHAHGAVNIALENPAALNLQRAVT